MVFLKRFLVVVAILAIGNLLWRAAGWMGLYTPSLAGRIAYVYDGDTVRIGKTRVRLWGIDAAELNTPQGRAARDWAVRAWEGRRATCRRLGETRGRLLARCRIRTRRGGRGIHRDMGRQIIEAGHACEWRRYSQGHYGRRLTCERLGRR